VLRRSLNVAVQKKLPRANPCAAVEGSGRGVDELGDFLLAQHRGQALHFLRIGRLRYTPGSLQSLNEERPGCSGLLRLARVEELEPAGPHGAHPSARWGGLTDQLGNSPYAVERTVRLTLWQFVTLQKLRFNLILLPGAITRPQNRPVLRLKDSPFVQKTVQQILARTAKLTPL
jgi:hypothetical protein